MIKLEFPVKTEHLSQVGVGSLIVRQSCQHAFAAALENDPSQRVLVLYDAPRSRFVCDLYQHETALVFGADLVLSPVIESMFWGIPDNTSTNEMYLIGERPHVFARYGEDRMVLDLTSGLVKPARHAQFCGFREWSICARVSELDLSPLIEFESRTASEMD